MRRERLPDGALRLEVSTPAISRTRIEATGTGLLWVWQETRPVLLARVAADSRGVALPAPARIPAGPATDHRRCGQDGAVLATPVRVLARGGTGAVARRMVELAAMATAGAAGRLEKLLRRPDSSASSRRRVREDSQRA